MSTSKPTEPLSAADVVLDPSRRMGQAHVAVGKAVQAGLLPKLDGSIPCVDCGAPAVNYDHRDYLRPLDVHPVCRSCNWRRGRGLNWDAPVPVSRRRWHRSAAWLIGRS